jgi:hypothetical protein
VILLESCASPRFTTSLGVTTQAFDVPIGTEHDTNTGIFEWGVVGEHWNKKGDKGKLTIEGQTDAQIFTGNEEVEMGISYSEFLEYHITDKISVRAGGGPTAIYNGGHFEGLDQSILYGNVRGGFKVHDWLIGFEHYSSPFDDDGGINLFTIGREW